MNACLALSVLVVSEWESNVKPRCTRIYAFCRYSLDAIANSPFQVKRGVSQVVIGVRAGCGGSHRELSYVLISLKCKREMIRWKLLTGVGFARYMRPVASFPPHIAKKKKL